MPTNQELVTAAVRLHAYLLRRHYTDGVLRGPDAGVRLNLRLWRFVKSALEFLPWRDQFVFMQTQGYWILSNWMLYESTGEQEYRRLAVLSTEATLSLQRPEGYWAYPLPERRNLIATVEGDWGALGLLSTHARERRPEFLTAALRWCDFLIERIGFQAHPPGKAVNYFDRPRGKVPNNSVEAAWLFLRLWKITGETRFLEHVEPLLQFVAAVQLPSGEIPYVVESPDERARQHYLCFQYNAFQFLKLAWLNAIKPGTLAERILPRLAAFLEAGVNPSGACREDCSMTTRGGAEVDYYTAVLAAALGEAARMGPARPGGLVKSTEPSEHCFARVLSRQRPDGGFVHSTGDYGFLSDRRSYPRPQAMTLFHLLYPVAGDGFPLGT